MTELEDTLATLVRNVPGAVFAAVGGMDGLLVEQTPDDRDDLPEAVAELTTVLSIAHRTVGELLGGGPVARVTIDAEDLSIGIWTVTDEYWCILASTLILDLRVAGPAARDAVERIRGSLT